MDYLLFWTKFILCAFAVYRLAEIVSIDSISEQIRQWFGKRVYKKHSGAWYLSELISCPYCIGVWFAFPFSFLFLPVNIIQFILIWISLAGMQTFLESLSNGRN